MLHVSFDVRAVECLFSNHLSLSRGLSRLSAASQTMADSPYVCIPHGTYQKDQRKTESSPGKKVQPFSLGPTKAAERILRTTQRELTKGPQVRKAHREHADGLARMLHCIHHPGLLLSGSRLGV